MRLKRSVVRSTRQLQCPGALVRKELKLQPPVISQWQLNEAAAAKDRAESLFMEIREWLTRGAEVEAGNFMLVGQIGICPDCGCSFSEHDGTSFDVVDAMVKKAQPVSKVLSVVCPRCAAREIIEDEVGRAFARRS